MQAAGSMPAQQLRTQGRSCAGEGSAHAFKLEPQNLMRLSGHRVSPDTGLSRVAGVGARNASG